MVESNITLHFEVQRGILLGSLLLIWDQLVLLKVARGQTFAN